MNPSSCPDQQQLVAYVNGALSLEAADAIAEHLERCASCEQAVAALERQPGALAAELRAIPDRVPVADQVDSPRPAGENALLQPTRYSATEGPGTCIGWYKLLQQLGQGGMGTVYMAEQEQPVKRRVALKIIKPGMDSAQVIARFEQERQALAMMDHPNIAKVFDAGTTEASRPFFVMELVKGIPITKFCDHEHLTPRERLELFIPVCQAVQHAHQKGIIHRDLKPSNVLIALYDGKPIPKVIDFGVAKATAQKLTERTMFTEVGQMVGTIEYMAPEQAELNNLDIDTRADIYSLGVILYELLTGSPPFSRKQLQSAAFTEMLRIIREVEPPKPSTKLSSSDELPSIAAQRKLEPKRLTKLVHGDLDWIAMKCLEKDRGRRYETANGLAMEIHRYLADEPVLAGPPSVGYRLRKFVRRNRGKVIAAAALVVTLLAGIAGTTVGLVHAVRAEKLERLARRDADEQRNRAVALAQEMEQLAERERSAKEDAEAKRQEAETAQDETKQVLDYLVAAFRKPDPDADGEKLTVAQLFDQAAEQLDTTFPNQPLIQARLLNSIGLTYGGLSLYQKAIAVLERARNLHRNELGEDHEDTLLSMSNLAGMYQFEGRLAEALLLHKQTLEIRKARLGPAHPDTLTSMNNLAGTYESAGRLAEALSLYEQTVELRKTMLGQEHRSTLSSMNNLANAYHASGRLAEAVPLYERTLELRKVILGAKHPETLQSMNNLAGAYYSASRLQEALPLLEQTSELMTAKLGPKHQDTLNSMNNLAHAYKSAGRLSEALPLFEQTLELRKTTLGPEHPDTLTSMNNLASLHKSAGRLAEALPLFEQTLELRKAKLGPEHPSTLASMSNLADAYRSAGRLAEALPLFEQTLELKKAKLGPEHPDTLGSMYSLAYAYASAEKLAEALALYEQALELMKAKLGPEHPTALALIGNLAKTYLVGEQPEKALPLFGRFIAVHRGRATPDDPIFAGLLASVSLDLLKHRQYPAAETYLRECLTIREKKLPDDWVLFNTKSLLGGALAGQKKFQEAEPLLVEGYSGMKEREAKIPPAAKTRLPEAIRRLVDLYTVWDRPEEAMKWQAILEESAAKP